MKREQRLRSAADFSRARERAARAWTHPLLVLYAAPNDLSQARVGVTVSGRVGKAVVRNKVRRRMREAVRLLLPRLVSGHDLVLTARPASAGADWGVLRQAVEETLRRAGLLLLACDGSASRNNSVSAPPTRPGRWGTRIDPVSEP